MLLGDSRARQARRRSAALTFSLALLFAVGGGILATLIYDGVSPRSVGLRLGLGEAWAAPAAGTSESTLVDPLRQAIQAAQLSLGVDAFAEVVVDRDRDVVFLLGRADSRRTLAKLRDAVAAVAGVHAVDTRGVRIVDRSHVVERGDNLWKLARRYYGFSAAWRVIRDANPQIERRGLRPGATILVPPLDR